MLKNKTISAIFIAINITIVSMLTGCSDTDHETQGYIEANLTYVSTSAPGRLVDLAVHRGESVQAGQLLFKLEKDPYAYKEASAKYKLAQAQASYEDKLTGKRLPYLKQIESDINGAKAQYKLDQDNYIRSKDLYKKKAISLQEFQRSESVRDKSLANIHSLEHQLTGNKLPERVKLIEASKDAVSSAQSQLQLSKWNLEQLTVKSPVSGMIFDNYYWKGEQVNSFMPVVSILVPDQIKLVFFVTEPDLSKVKIGEDVKFKVDGVKTSYDARVSFISNVAEYTPPVIYSEQSRKDLVYRIEAKIVGSAAKNWHPGLPVSIILPTGKS
jgi:HlyD family secretion protein